MYKFFLFISKFKIIQFLAGQIKRFGQRKLNIFTTRSSLSAYRHRGACSRCYSKFGRYQGYQRERF